jgi:cytoskeletal protein RodZ
MQSTPDNNLDDVFDETFIDEAWKNMNVMLDREMPVEKKRNCGLLIWWTNSYAICIAAGVALLFGIGVWRTVTNITTNYETTYTTQDSTNQAVTTTKSHESAHISTAPSKKSINITTNQYDHEAANLHANKHLDSAIAMSKYQQHDHENILLTPKKHFNTDTSPMLPIAGDPILPIIVHVNIDTSVALANSERQNDAQKAISTSTLEAVNTHTLPALPLALLENIPIKEYMYENAMATIPQKSRRWKAGIYPIFNSPKSLVGVELGIAKSFRWSDKIALTVGISGMRRNYNVAFPDSSISVIRVVQSSPVSSMNPDSSNTTYLATNILFNSLHLPIICSRMVSKNWSLGAGITPTYNLKQSSASVFKTQNPKSFRRFNILSGLYATCTLDKLNIVAGVEYNILGHNIYNNTGHSVTMKVGVERKF